MFSERTTLKDNSRNLSYADAHCHLLPDYFEMNEVTELSKKALENGVKIIVNSAVNPENYQFGLDTTKLEGMYLAVGYETTKIIEERYKQLIVFYEAHKESIKAIGEVGLDFHWIKETDKRELQIEYFGKIIDYTLGKEIPLVIHSRGAESKTIEILKQKGAEDVLMHCFEGDEEQAKEISRLS